MGAFFAGNRLISRSLIIFLSSLTPDLPPIVPQPIGGELLAPTLTPSTPTLKPVRELISAGDNENLYGSRTLILSSEYQQQQQKGIEKFVGGEYKKAHDAFKDIRDSASPQSANPEELPPRKDPEILIFQNNSEARSRHKESGSPIYTIAASIPISDELGNPWGVGDIGQQILFGVALAQEQALKDKINLEVVIANDRNLPDQAEALASELTKQSIVGIDKVEREILAVIGHYSSTVTCKALPTYNEAQVAIISSTSTLTNLRKECGGGDVFFRTTSSSKIEVNTMIDYLTKDSGVDQPRIAVFYRKGEKFSEDMLEQLQDAQKDEANRQVFNFISQPIDLSKPDFDAEKELDKVIAANVIAVFPDGRTLAAIPNSKIDNRDSHPTG